MTKAAFKRSRKSGFTLIEILIVVIILGILAAIVIPQFTNASQDARKNSLTSQLQTIRSQVELYRLQHLGQLPPTLVDGGATAAVWVEMTAMTDATHEIGTGALFPFGPYLQQAPSNSLNNSVGVGVVTGATDYGSGGVANTSGNVGWVLNDITGKVWATSTQFGFIYNESNSADTNNDL